MNKMTRLLTVTGMGALAALAIGAGPAQAAGSNATTAAKPAPTTAKAPFGWDRDRTVGFYRSGRACEVAGRIGERFGRWDDYDCNFVRFGFRRGTWELNVSDRGWDRGHRFPGHGFPGGHDRGHDHDHGHDHGHRR
jgi:hypothetical protein